MLTSQGISSLGDAVSFTALPLLVLALTGSGLAMGIVGALQTLPDLVFGMVAGALADRADRKRMMFLADLGRAVLTALDPDLRRARRPDDGRHPDRRRPDQRPPLVLPGRATPSSVPALVGRSQIARANSYFETVYSIGYILGPAIAGVLATTIGPGPTLAIDAVSFALSGVGLLFVRRDLRAPVDRPREPLLTEIREGHRLHRPPSGPADGDPVLGRDLDPDRAPRHRAGGPDHARPRLRRRRSWACS